PGIGSVAMSQMVAAVAGACASTASIITAQFVATDSILLGATDAQRQAWLPRAAAGEGSGSCGLTEPGAGANPVAVSTNATRGDAGAPTTGTKSAITTAAFAAFIIGYARRDGEAGHQGISVFIVDPATAGDGLSFHPPEKTMGLRDSPVYQFV